MMKTTFKDVDEAFKKAPKHAPANAVRKAIEDLQDAVAKAEDGDFISNAVAAGLQDEITALAERLGHELIATKKPKKEK